MKTKAPSRKAARRANIRKTETAKRNLAHSTPLFNPREAWAPRKKVGGVPFGTLMDKQHQPYELQTYWCSMW